MSIATTAIRTCITTTVVVVVTVQRRANGRLSLFLAQLLLQKEGKEELPFLIAVIAIAIAVTTALVAIVARRRRCRFCRCRCRSSRSSRRITCHGRCTYVVGYVVLLIV